MAVNSVQSRASGPARVTVARQRHDQPLAEADVGRRAMHQHDVAGADVDAVGHRHGRAEALGVCSMSTSARHVDACDGANSPLIACRPSRSAAARTPPRWSGRTPQLDVPAGRRVVERQAAVGPGGQRNGASASDACRLCARARGRAACRAGSRSRRLEHVDRLVGCRRRSTTHGAVGAVLEAQVACATTVGLRGLAAGPQRRRAESPPTGRSATSAEQARAAARGKIAARWHGSFSPPVRRAAAARLPAGRCRVSLQARCTGTSAEAASARATGSAPRVSAFGMRAQHRLGARDAPGPGMRPQHEVGQAFARAEAPARCRRCRPARASGAAPIDPAERQVDRHRQRDADAHHDPAVGDRVDGGARDSQAYSVQPAIGDRAQRRAAAQQRRAPARQPASPPAVRSHHPDQQQPRNRPPACGRGTRGAPVTASRGAPCHSSRSPVGRRAGRPRIDVAAHSSGSARPGVAYRMPPTVDRP